MVLHPDDLADRSRALAYSILRCWPDASEAEAPPHHVRDAAVGVRDAADHDALREALEQFIEVAAGATGGEQPWADTPVGALLRGLYSAGKQYLHSAGGKEVIRLCNEIRAAVETIGHLERHPNELMAALMAVEDAVSAIEGYAALRPFLHVDEAYLAKYGLLQAVQVGFDGAEGVARTLGLTLRADAMPGGKAVKIARNIIAGHPLGGNMQGESWHHFHDRATAHDKAVIRVMSFSRPDPERWTGQTLATEGLVTDAVGAIAELLRRALDDYRGRHA
ncbi:MAG TPA: hypothetical protein VMS64_29540 [Candidatus Methylomirabilis sp.]|nr:hypothetical protein [Candidatus Methylomirabilis sp.]